jgi:hypothetical protein
MVPPTNECNSDERNQKLSQSNEEELHEFRNYLHHCTTLELVLTMSSFLSHSSAGTCTQLCDTTMVAELDALRRLSVELRGAFPLVYVLLFGPNTVVYLHIMLFLRGSPTKS